jgi:hypothetical protein
MLVSRRISLRAVIRVRKGAICTVLIVKTLLSVDAFLFVNCDIIVTIILKPLNSYVYKIISLEFKIIRITTTIQYIEPDFESLVT